MFPPTNSPEHLHNLRNSHLHQLPAELILQISEELRDDPAAILTIRLVSRDFCLIFEPPFIIEPDHRDAFKAILRRDNVSWYSRWERHKGLQNLPHATCSSCKSRHSKSQFTPQELENGPENRICIPASQTLRLGHNTQLSFNAILAMGNPPSQPAWQSRAQTLQWVSICTSTPKTAHTGEAVESTIAHMYTTRHLDVLRRIRLVHGPRDGPVTDNLFLIAFDSIRKYVCADIYEDKHVRLEDLRPGAKPPRKRPAPLDHHSPWQYAAREFYWRKCCACPRKRRCGSWFFVHRQHSEADGGADEVFLHVFKSYQPAGHCADPEWARKYVRRMAGEQHQWNGWSNVEFSTVLYEGKVGGEWGWSEILG